WQDHVARRARPTRLAPTADCKRDGLRNLSRGGDAGPDAPDRRSRHVPVRERGTAGILNSGHRQGGSVIRTVGEDFEPRSFSTYSASAIALIGKLPATLTDRSVPIELRRRRPDEPIQAFRFDQTEHLDQLARKAA